MADKLVTIATFSEPSQAEISKAKLEEVGINCFLTEDATHNLYGYAAGTIRLQIRESDAERALEALKVDGKKRCTQCGQEVQDSAKYCANCGAETGDCRQGEVTGWTCTKCGEQVEDQFDVCWKCGTGRDGSPPKYVVGPPTPTVPTYLTEAILVTLFCCVPLGIVAIVDAANAKGKLEAGDYAGARETSAKAKTWCWVSFVAGFIIIAIYVLAQVLAQVRS